MMFKCMLVSMMLIVSLAGVAFPDDASIRIVDKPDTEAKNDFYVVNRAPSMPSPLIKLPVVAIKPVGWVSRQPGADIRTATGGAIAAGFFRRYSRMAR